MNQLLEYCAADVAATKQWFAIRHAIELHERLDRWVARIEKRCDDRGIRPIRFTVAQVTTDGIRFLFAPGVFTDKPALAWSGTKADAAAFMVEGFNIHQGAHGEAAAKEFWKGQRVIPLDDTGNHWVDFP